MTNTPAVVLAGASAVAPAGRHGQDIRLVETMFGAVGDVVALDEQDLDAVTGLSGSGPAFVCLAVEALADGGVKGRTDAGRSRCAWPSRPSWAPRS